jgi:hypothetical protein
MTTTLTEGLAAKEVLALVAARKVGKPKAIAYLQARVDAAVKAGRKPRFATRKALADLRGLDEVEALPEGLATLKQASKARKAAAEPKAPATPKATGKRKATPAKAATPKPANPLDAAVSALAGLDDKQLAAFLRSVMDARK